MSNTAETGSSPKGTFTGTQINNTSSGYPFIHASGPSAGLQPEQPVFGEGPGRRPRWLWPMLALAATGFAVYSFLSGRGRRARGFGPGGSQKPPEWPDSKESREVK